VIPHTRDRAARGWRACAIGCARSTAGRAPRRTGGRSQSTNDRNRDVAFLALRRRFGDARAGTIDWRAVRDAPLEQVEEAIRPGGISKVKSARIQAILRAIGEPLSLDWMRDAPVNDSRAALCELPGVGRKTAACVLLFSFGCREVPVDTHVARVGTRLGLLRPGAPFEELHDTMLALARPGEALKRGAGARSSSCT
jgi:endonuclease-3